jgi:hypothetical protein
MPHGSVSWQYRKVERFFRTVPDQFLARELDLASLEGLNRQFTHWVEEQYNAQIHSVLGMTPLDRFALDRNRVRFLPPNEANDELFFVEEERHVRADNTFSFQAVRFEAPRVGGDIEIQKIRPVQMTNRQIPEVAPQACAKPTHKLPQRVAS